MRLQMKLELYVCQPIDQNSSVLDILTLLIEYTMLVLMSHHMHKHILSIEPGNQTLCLSRTMNQFPTFFLYHMCVCEYYV